MKISGASGLITVCLCVEQKNHVNRRENFSNQSMNSEECGKVLFLLSHMRSGVDVSSSFSFWLIKCSRPGTYTLNSGSMLIKFTAALLLLLLLLFDVVFFCLLFEKAFYQREPWKMWPRYINEIKTYAPRPFSLSRLLTPTSHCQSHSMCLHY